MIEDALKKVLDCGDRQCPVLRELNAVIRAGVLSGVPYDEDEKLVLQLGIAVNHHAPGVVERMENFFTGASEAAA